MLLKVLSSTVSRVPLVPTFPLVLSILYLSMLTPSSYEHGLVDLENPKWEGKHQEPNENSENWLEFRGIVYDVNTVSCIRATPLQIWF